MLSSGGPKKKRPVQGYDADDDDDEPTLEQALARHLAAKTREEKRKKPTHAETTAHLSALFKETSENLGSPVKAAYAEAQFVQFLDPQQLRELREYKQEMKAAKNADK